MRLNFYLKEESEDIAKRVIILTSKPEENHEQKLMRTASRLEDSANKSGLKPFIVFSEDAYIKNEGDIISIHNNEGKGFIIDPENTIVINRGSVSKFLSSMDLISQLEKAGFFCINSRECIEDCSDKYKTFLKLKEIGVPTPKTALLRSEEGIDRVLKDIGGKFPVVIKTLKGSKGIGVFITEGIENMKSVLQTIWKLVPDVELLAQEYIESDGDLRIHVLGDKVIAGMKRMKNKDDFRANFSLGGTVKPVKILEDTAAVAMKANKAVKGIWTGVDIIKDKKGQQYVIEVNSSPGSEGIEKASKKDVVKIVLEYAKDKKNWLLKTIDCGWLEYIFIKGLGKVKAKFDTGNGSCCVIETDGYNIDKKKNIIHWKYNGKKMSTKLIDIKDIFVGGLRSFEDNRPITELEIEFNGKKYTEEFALDDNRKGRIPILLNRLFIKRARLSIDPSKKYILSIPEKEIEKKT